MSPIPTGPQPVWATLTAQEEMTKFRDQDNDELTGCGADKFQCDSGDDTVYDYNPEEGDKITGDCENIF